VPLYEYACDACGHRFELIQKFSDPPVSTCPSCGDIVRKLVSTPAIQFKGSGWYVTDYARKGDGASRNGDRPEGGEKKAEDKTAHGRPAAEGKDSQGFSTPETSGSTSKS